MGLRVSRATLPSARGSSTIGSSPSALGQREGAGDVVDLPGGHAGRRAARRPTAAASRAASARDQHVAQRRRGARPARRWWRSARRGPAPARRDLAQRRELLVVADREDELAVGGGEELVGRDRRVRVAHPARDGAGQRVGRALVDQRGEQATRTGRPRRAGPRRCASRWRSGGQDADRGEEPGDDVDQRDADLLRLAVGLAGDGHQAAERLDEQVVARQRRAGARAEAGDRAVDQRGVGGRERSSSRGRAGPSRRAGSSRPRRRRPRPARAPARRPPASVRSMRLGALVAVDRLEVGGVARARRTAGPRRGCRRRRPAARP